ncbi:hypothetical protein RND81_06G201100 [Saponaria officinalis]|uniref:RRM domain-containing protein n=1 Tax=Saponaria officinalis TaxID=3572 RepID=A0AAW1KDM0_SAPOF
MASTISLSSIVTPSSSSSTFLSSTHFHSFTHFSPKHLLKTLSLKPRIVTPLLFPLRHLCRCAGGVDTVISDELEQNSVDVVQEKSEENEIDENDDDNNSVEKSDSSDEGRVYVGNLPYNMTSSELSEIFSRAGQIKSVEIIYDKMTNRSRGFGFVTMETIDEAREVIRMFDGSQVGGRTVRVNFPEVPKGGERKIMGPKIRIANQSFVDTSHKVYAGNLGWGVTTQGLKDAFADQAEFVSAKVVYERDTGRSRGFGFVSFKSAEAAQSAINAMDGVELEGRPLRLNVAADRSRANTEIATEQSNAVSAVNS